MQANKLVIFDFCGTLISFQTADRYVDYCLRCHPLPSARWQRCLLRLLEKTKVFALLAHIKPGNNWHKRMVLRQLKGYGQSLCEQLAADYLHDELLPNVVQPVLEIMKQHLADGDNVCILSGGYDIYLRCFADCFRVPLAVGSAIRFDNEICTGKLYGKDCMGINKIAFYNELPYDKSDVTFYTDSPTDIPLLKMVTHPIVVSHKYSQQWARQLGFREIIWN